MANDKPYLETIDRTPEARRTALEWARYLAGTFGTGGALDSLQYYERLEWITVTVRRRMTDYLRGLSMEELNTKQYDDPESLSGHLEPLSGTPFAAHSQSLSYIAALAGDDLQDLLLSLRLVEARVDGDSA